MSNSQKKCCANCKLSLELQKWDYSANGGVKHELMPGYACMIFASEGLCIHMTGCDKEEGVCECYTPRDKK